MLGMGLLVVETLTAESANSALITHPRSTCPTSAGFGAPGSAIFARPSAGSSSSAAGAPAQGPSRAQITPAVNTRPFEAFIGPLLRLRGARIGRADRACQPEEALDDVATA